jgi:hypothetical protein
MVPYTSKAAPSISGGAVSGYLTSDYIISLMQVSRLGVG